MEYSDTHTQMLENSCKIILQLYLASRDARKLLPLLSVKIKITENQWVQRALVEVTILLFPFKIPFRIKMTFEMPFVDSNVEVKAIRYCRLYQRN